jgi:hypothetical protein
MASPPVLGTGTTCNERLLGRSSASRLPNRETRMTKHDSEMPKERVADQNIPSILKLSVIVARIGRVDIPRRIHLGAKGMRDQRLLEGR